jgi:hypothetical protein
MLLHQLTDFDVTKMIVGPSILSALDMFTWLGGEFLNA